MLRLLKSFLPSSEKIEGADCDYQRHFNRFQKILKDEHSAINERRTALGRRPLGVSVSQRRKGGAQRPMYETAGVALSGGGIRSAAFCLGALQSLALTQRVAMPATPCSLFDHVDYLSTVSGGGYIGSAVSAAMAQPTDTPQRFPFARPGRVDDEPSVGHLRDYSNYLLPRGGGVWFDAMGVLLRGFATNLVFIFAGIMFFAAIAVFAYPTLDILEKHGSLLPFFLAGLISYLPCWSGVTEFFRKAEPFLLTWIALAILGLHLLVWALLRSRPKLLPTIVRDGLLSDVRGFFVAAGKWLVILTLTLAVMDLTPFLIDGFLKVVRGLSGESLRVTLGTASSAAAIVAVFKNRLSAVLKINSLKPGSGAMAKRIAARAVVWMAASILPLVLWVSYLAISAAGIKESGIGLAFCSADSWFWCNHDAAPMYAAIWIILFVLTNLFDPNANSLHQVYRDKLSKAFLVDPDWRATEGTDAWDLIPRDSTKLSEISPATGGPYQIINAAINLQGSVQANRRGRNASFFIFSSKFVGSDVTDYVDTLVVEDEDPHLNLGSATAISGAAVSSDMGSSSIAALSPTLALLNIRLGYWMKNPRILLENPRPAVTWKQWLLDRVRTYVFSEMFGQLDEKKRRVYLTDGGHIENLGLYSLLKRHCSLIVVVDAEADPTLTFRALAICERYARIDLGVRVDLPWQDIAAIGNAATKLAEDGNPLPLKGGPHCCVGTILYPGGEHGVLVYVKASVTGDEPDYVMDYKRRNPVFPHESTGDQFFTEEQFELYRALGFHALDGLLSDARAYTASDQVKADAKAVGLGVPEYVKSLFPG